MFQAGIVASTFRRVRCNRSTVRPNLTGSTRAVGLLLQIKANRCAASRALDNKTNVCGSLVAAARGLHWSCGTFVQAAQYF